jgi:hypothetical protein
MFQIQISKKKGKDENEQKEIAVDLPDLAYACAGDDAACL